MLTFGLIIEFNKTACYMLHSVAYYNGLEVVVKYNGEAVSIHRYNGGNPEQFIC